MMIRIIRKPLCLVTGLLFCLGTGTSAFAQVDPGTYRLVQPRVVKIKAPDAFERVAQLQHLGAYANVASTKGPVSEAVATPDAVALGMAKAKTYSFASADFPGAGSSDVFDENSSMIVGTTTFGSSELAFALKGTSYQLLDLAGAQASVVTGINTSGQMVGIYEDATAATHGFLDNSGVLTNIDDPDAAVGQTDVLDINDGGEIVGFYTDTANVMHGFFTTDSGVSFSNVDFPGAVSTQAVGVNSAGEIVGTWTDATSNTHGFSLMGGVFTTFDFPLALSTTAFGINDAGEIAGFFSDATTEHGFVYSDGQFTQIDVAGASSVELTRIKNNGRITGIYIDSTNEVHGLTGH
jgi:probable HAF family extracellular repeat protein